MLYNLEYYHQARITYRMAIAFDPLYKNTYLALAKKLIEKATHLFESKEYTKARFAYTEAMALDPNYIGVFADKEAPFITQGEACYKQGDYQQALAIYEQVLQFNPDNKDAQTAKKEVIHKLEQIAEEKRIAEHLKSLTTNNSWLCEEPFRHEL
jgi:tetratricopeptide (TPR) repeat protein